jgi:hypothetical protein
VGHSSEYRCLTEYNSVYGRLIRVHLLARSLLLELKVQVLVKKQEVLGRTNLLLSFDTTRTAYKMTRPTTLLLRVFIAAVTFLTEPLRSNVHMRTQTDGRN